MKTSCERMGNKILPFMGILWMLVVPTITSVASSPSNQDDVADKNKISSSDNVRTRNFFSVFSDNAREGWSDFWHSGSPNQTSNDQLQQLPEAPEMAARDVLNSDPVFITGQEDGKEVQRIKRRLQLKTTVNDQRSRAHKQGMRQQRRNRQRNKFMKTVARNKMNSNRRINTFARMRVNPNMPVADEAQRPVDKPNIILIVADDLGFNDVPWHNPDVQAPNLLRLARKGVMLENHYVLPLCTPSRAALLTGDYPFRHGKQAGESSPLSPTGLNASLTLLPQRLRNLGYNTHLIGKWHLGYCSWDYTPTRRGFDSFYGYYLGSQTYYTQYKKLGHKKGPNALRDRNEVEDFDADSLDEEELPRFSETLKEEQLQQIISERRQQTRTSRTESLDQNGGRDFRFNETPLSNVSGTYSNELYARRAEKVIREHAAKGTSRGGANNPLFLMLSTQAVHGPVEVPLEYRRRYTATTRNLARRTFLGMVSALDEVVGRVVKQLKASGLYRNSIIVFTTDNGGNIQAGGNNFPLRGNKGGVFEGGTRGVAFIHSPLLPKSGYKFTGLMHIVDWHDTLLHIAQSGASIPRGPAKRNLLRMPFEANTSAGQGRGRDSMNLWPAIVTNTESPRKSFVYNVRKKPLRGAVRRKNWKLIIGEGGRYDSWVPPSDVNAGGRKEMANGRCCSTWHSSIQNKNVMLYNLKDDPLETTDISYLYPDVTATLKSLLRQYAAESRHPHIPPDNPLGHPSLHGGFFSPGWCQAQG